MITVDGEAYDFETCPPITRDSKVEITMYYTYSDEAGSKNRQQQIRMDIGLNFLIFPAWIFQVRIR